MAQVIPFAVSPVLTRLFTPGDFALLAVFVGVAAPASVLATGRYELAILLPEDDERARDVRSLVIMSGFAVSTLALVVALALRAISTRHDWNWLLAVPVTMTATAVYQAYAYWANRQKAYRSLAASSVVQQLVIAIASVIGGFLFHSAYVLVIALVVGQAAAALFIMTTSHEAMRLTSKSTALRTAAKEYWRFPTYNLPYSFLGTFSSGALPVMMAGVGYRPAAGLFTQARRILYAPANLLGVSIGQVYFREAASSIGQPSLEELTIRTLRTLAWVVTPVYVFGTWWAPEIFGLVFGRPWRDAGVIARAFGPVAFCYLFTSWPERIYEVTQNQRLSFVLQLVADGTTLTVFLALLLFDVPPVRAIAIYAAMYSIYHVVYLSIIARIANFTPRRMLVVLRDILSIGALSGLALLLIRFVPSPSLQFALGATFVVAFAVVSLRRWQLIPLARTARSFT